MTRCHELHHCVDDFIPTNILDGNTGWQDVVRIGTMQLDDCKTSLDNGKANGDIDECLPIDLEFMDKKSAALRNIGE